MPDGDIVHSQLSGLYQKPYKVLCEGKRDRGECTWVVMNAVMRDIKKKGAAPVVLAKRMGERLRQVIGDAGENGSVDWAARSIDLNKLARQSKCPHYVKEIVLRAGKRILHELRYGGRVKSSSLPETFVEQYFQEVYKSNFEERIPLTLNHHTGVDKVIVTERIKALRTDVSPMFCEWAKRANADEDVANLRRPRRQKVNEVDLNEDLL